MVPPVWERAYYKKKLRANKNSIIARKYIFKHSPINQPLALGNEGALATAQSVQQKSQLYFESSHQVVALACCPFMCRSYFRKGKRSLLCVYAAPITLGLKCNQNKLSGGVILTGLDMKIMALKEHASEEPMSEKTSFLFLLNKLCKFSCFFHGLRMYLVKRKHLSKWWGRRGSHMPEWTAS